MRKHQSIEVSSIGTARHIETVVGTMIRKKITAADNVADISASLLQQREKTIAELMKAHESNTDWLNSAVEVCGHLGQFVYRLLSLLLTLRVTLFMGQTYKRKISEGARVEHIVVSQPAKKAKPETVDPKEKENSRQNVINQQPQAQQSKSEKKPMANSNESMSNVVDVSSHPQYLQVMSMKVVQLRQMLKGRSLESGGLKKDLQKRLLTAMVAEENGAISPKKKPAPKSFSSTTMSNDNGDTVDDEVEAMQTDEIESPVDDSKSDEKTNAKNKSVSHVEAETVDLTESMNTEKKDVIPHQEKANEPIKSNNVEQTKSTIAEELSGMRSIVKNTARLFSPNRSTSKRSVVSGSGPSKSSTGPLNQKPSAQSPLKSFKRSLVKTASAILSPKEKKNPKTDCVEATKPNKAETASDSKISPSSLKSRYVH